MEGQGIVVMGGTGHIGLPLGLLLAQAGFPVTLFDTDRKSLETIRQGRIPFQEEGAEPLLRRVLAGGRLALTDDPACVRGADTVITVIGTPVDEHLSPTLTRFLRAMDSITDHLRDDQLLILRSTVTPGTSAFLNERFRSSGKRIHVSFCPERILEGKALEEIPRLPQIVSGFTPEAVARARAIFEKLGPEVIVLEPAEAELSKLFVNVWRYLKFAIANQFYMIANDAGVDFDPVYRSLGHNYPRGSDLPQPGFAAGPCLFKDTMQLAAASRVGFHLGHVAMQVNEGLPDYVVRRLSAAYPLGEMTVGILGMAFKAESDDIRESLSYKLRRLLALRAARVLCADPYVPDPGFVSAETLVADSDLIIVAAPHRAFASLDLGGKPVADIWNLFGKGRKI